MAEGRIDSIVNIPAVQSEIDATKKGVRELIELLKSVKGNAIDISGAKNVSEFNKLNQELHKNIDLTNKAANAAINQASASRQVTSVIKQENLSLSENIILRERLKNSLVKLKKEQAENTKLFKDGLLTQEQYSKSVSTTGTKIEQYKNKVSDLDKTIKLQTASTRALTKEEKLQQAVTETQRNSLGRAQALILLYTEQKKKLNLATAEGALLNDNYNKAIARTNLFLKANADEITKQSKNVGNYAGSLGGFFNKLLGPLRTLANIIPGLGIGGIFLLFGEGISGAAKGLGLFNSKLSETERNRKNLLEVEKQAAESAGVEAANLKVLRATIESTKVPMATRLQAIKNLREQFPGYFAELSNENLLTGNAANAYNEAAKGILRKAKASAAAGEIERLAKEKLVILQKAENDEAETNDRIRNAKSKTIGFSGGSTTVSAEQEKNNALLRFNIRRQADQKELDAIQKQEDFLLKFVIAGADKVIEVEKEKAEKVSKIKSTSAKDAADAALKTQFDIDAKILQQVIDFQKEILDGDSIHYQDRADALSIYELAKIKLINETAELEKKLGKKTALELQLIEVEREDNLLRLRREVIKEEIKLREDVRKGIWEGEEELKKDLAKIAEKGTEDYFKELDKRREREKKDREEQKKAEEKLAEEKKRLQQRLTSEITELTFTFLTANIERQKNALQEQLNQLEITKAREIELAGGNADAIAVIEARAAVKKEEIQRRQRELDIRKARFDKAQSVARIIQETAIAIVGALKTPALIPLIAAVGAAQLAQVLATPIPKYKDGTDNHPGGLMVVGDGRKHEGITFPDGTTMKSPAVDTLMYAPPGTVVHPDFNQMMLQAGMGKPANIKTVKPEGNGKVVKGLKAVEKAIAKIPQTSITVSNPLKQRVRTGSSINNHIKRNIG